MMKDNIVKNKTFEFALRVVKLYKFLTIEKKEYVLSKQILRSGTSVGAMIREAEQAESNADFVHKLSIALKEANETEYWLDLLYGSEFIDELSYQSVKNDIIEILRLLISIIKTKKERNGK